MAALRSEAWDAGRAVKDHLSRLCGAIEGSGMVRGVARLFATPSRMPAAFLASSRHACMAPWVHLHADPQGQVRPCCISTREPLGNLRQQSLAEIWTGAHFEGLREEMIRDEPAAGCERCYDNERVGIVSQRRQWNTMYRRHARLLGVGPAKSVPTDYDVRFSNICNFRCRTCWAGLSSRWFSDHRAVFLTSPHPTAITSCTDDLPGLLNEVEPWLGRAEHVYFAGGEPLLQHGHYELLARLLAHDRRNVRLSYNTNLSTLRFAGHDCLELWRRFSDVTVNVSIDGIERRGEYLRDGQDWVKLLGALSELRRECPHVRVGVNCTLGVLNALHFHDLVVAVVERGLCDIERVHLNLLHEPEYYCIRTLPADFKRRVSASLLAHADWIGQHARRADWRRRRALSGAAETVRNTVRFMMAEDWSHRLPELVRVTAALDARRKQDVVDVFPELAPLFRRADAATLAAPSH